MQYILPGDLYMANDPFLQNETWKDHRISIYAELKPGVDPGQIAAAIAPLEQWLQQYTYRISIGLWFFVATIVGSLVIAWLTVGYTAIKAALANPVNSLRSE